MSFSFTLEPETRSTQKRTADDRDDNSPASQVICAPRVTTSLPQQHQINENNMVVKNMSKPVSCVTWHTQRTFGQIKTTNKRDRMHFWFGHEVAQFWKIRHLFPNPLSREMFTTFNATSSASCRSHLSSIIIPTSIFLLASQIRLTYLAFTW